jgi:hypothetical protein
MGRHDLTTLTRAGHQRASDIVPGALRKLLRELPASPYVFISEKSRTSFRSRNGHDTRAVQVLPSSFRDGPG